MKIQKSAAFVLAVAFVFPSVSYTSSTPVAASEDLLVAEVQQKIGPDPEVRSPDICLMDGCSDDDLVICPASRRVTEKREGNGCTRRSVNIKPLENLRRGRKVDAASRGSRPP